MISACPCISFRDIPGQGIDMHALTASWDSLLPTELKENNLSTNHYILWSSGILTNQSHCDNADKWPYIFWNLSKTTCLKLPFKSFEAGDYHTGIRLWRNALEQVLRWNKIKRWHRSTECLTSLSHHFFFCLSFCQTLPAFLREVM